MMFMIDIGVALVAMDVADTTGCVADGAVDTRTKVGCRCLGIGTGGAKLLSCGMPRLGNSIAGLGARLRTCPVIIIGEGGECKFSFATSALSSFSDGGLSREGNPLSSNNDVDTVSFDWTGT